MLLTVILFLSLISCCTSKKIVTRTETIIKVDTVIRIIRDTVTYTNTVRLTDTAYIETETARARSYYDFKEGRLILKLTGKPFDQPLTIDKKTFSVEREKIPIENPFFKQIKSILLFISLVMIAVFIFLKLIKK